MAEYKPSVPFNVGMILLTPTYSKVQGVTKKSFPETGILINGSFKTYGGTERDVNGLFTIEDTATVETWYRPDIRSECRVKVGEAVYEILGQPENISLRNQYMRFKVRRVKGGA